MSDHKMQVIIKSYDKTELRIEVSAEEGKALIKSLENKKLKQTKQERVDIANKIIKKIASLGRGFFYCKSNETYGYFSLQNGKVFYTDDYAQEKLYAYGHKYLEKGFNHGGTLQALVMDFSEYIRTGKHTNGNNGYSGLYCPHWGYPEKDMKKIQEYATELGFLKGAGE